MYNFDVWWHWVNVWPIAANWLMQWLNLQHGQRVAHRLSKATNNHKYDTHTSDWFVLLNHWGQQHCIRASVNLLVSDCTGCLALLLFLEMRNKSGRKQKAGEELREFVRENLHFSSNCQHTGFVSVCVELQFTCVVRGKSFVLFFYIWCWKIAGKSRIVCSVCEVATLVYFACDCDCRIGTRRLTSGYRRGLECWP